MLKVLDQAREDNAETTQAAVPTLDALAREGARRMLAAALEEEVDSTSRRTPMRGTGTAGGWLSATAVRSRER